MNKKGFILIDYTNDFVATEGKLTVGEPGQYLETAICERLIETLESGGMVFVVNDIHQVNDLNHPEHQLFPPHNIEGTTGRTLYGKINSLVEEKEKQFPGKVIRLDKRRYSAFFSTPLEMILRQENISEIELAGVCTDICVLHTAIDAYNMGFKTTIDETMVASFNQSAHEMALEHVRSVLGFTVKRRG